MESGVACMYDNLLTKNWVIFLNQAMKENGCPHEVTDVEGILANLRYLARIDDKGTSYMPLQYKRIIEKLVCGLFNSAFEYEDKKDVYFERIGDYTVCCANVYWVQYSDDGSRRVLGHGFHSISVDDVISSSFNDKASALAKIKATAIGSAKSRALYDGGIGLEFYGDVFMPELNLDEKEETMPEGMKKTPVKEKSDKEYTADRLPIPTPKRGRKKKEADPVTPEAHESTPAAEAVPEKKEPAMSMEVARSLKADCGDFSGMTLGEIYENAPRALVFLVRNSSNTDVISAARMIIKSDAVMSERFSV